MAIADVQSLLKKIKEARLGEEVRGSIHDAIKQCYYDGKAGGNDLEARDRAAAAEARMDTFTSLKSGSTTGDAELVDIRVGADGTKYKNAGTAVREQVRNIHSIEVGTTQPTRDNTQLWINPNDYNTFYMPEIKDEEVNAVDTWSSGKIVGELRKSRDQIISINDLIFDGYVEQPTNQVITKFDTTTKIIVKGDNKSFNLYKVDIDLLNGRLYTNSFYAQDSTITNRLIYVTDENDIHIDMVRRTNIDTDNLGGSFKVTENGYILDIGSLKALYSNAKYIYINMEIACEIEWFTDTKSTTMLNKFSRTPEIILPSKAVAVENHEFNIYYDNVIICDNIDNYYVDCSISPSTFQNNEATIMLNECFRITPPIGSSGTYTVTINLCDKYNREVLVSNSITLKVIPDTEVSNKRVVFIGDSLTEAGVYPAEIQYNLSSGGIQSLGARSKTVYINGEAFTVNHEGRSGWSAYDYVTKYSDDNDYINSFWNPDTAKFDFSYYMSELGYSGVDIVCINLGTNSESISITCSAIDEMITSIHKYNSNIKILISLIPAGATQDGYGMRIGMQCSDSHKIAILNLVKEYIKRYDGVINNVDVTEVYFNLDRKLDFNVVEQAASARNPMIVVRQSNNVHPSIYGYLKFADVYYNNILYHLNS